MTMTLAKRRSLPCVAGAHICVLAKHGLVIVPASFVGNDRLDGRLHMYALADGSWVRSIGSWGRDRGQFRFFDGGLCVSPDGDSVLVAESKNNRVQQVRIVDGSWVRFVGDGVLDMPRYVDCNTDFIAVSEHCHRISVLFWADGGVRAQFGKFGSGLGDLNCPNGLRMLTDGSGLVVADGGNHRLCVFTLSGEVKRAVVSRVQGWFRPLDVLEDVSDGCFFVANAGSGSFVKINRHGFVVGGYCTVDAGAVISLAALPDNGLVVLSSGIYRDGYMFNVWFDHRHRLDWIQVCVHAALRTRSGTG